MLNRNCTATKQQARSPQRRLTERPMSPGQATKRKSLTSATPKRYYDKWADEIQRSLEIVEEGFGKGTGERHPSRLAKDVRPLLPNSFHRRNQVNRKKNDVMNAPITAVFIRPPIISWTHIGTCSAKSKSTYPPG